MTQHPFTCPDCGGRLVATSTATYEWNVNPVTGVVAKRTSSRQLNTGWEATVNCTDCLTPWEAVFYVDSNDDGVPVQVHLRRQDHTGEG